MADTYSQEPRLFTLRNGNGVEATIMDWGATIVSLKVQVKGEAQPRELLLGMSDPAQWSTQDLFFNATIGRYANRIANSTFTINGRAYALNGQGPHCLHGGREGFDKRRFTVLGHSDDEVTLCLHSPALDQGFPGNFDLTVTYRLLGDNTLFMGYLGKCDEVCPACITNHAYFNLNGRNGSVLGHSVRLRSREFLPLDGDAIPLGHTQSVRGTPFDFTEEKTLGRDFLADDQTRAALGYDHPFIIEGGADGPFATVTSDDGKVRLEVSSDYPAFQMYSGNYIHVGQSAVPARDGGIYQNQGGLCLEPEFFPNSPNLPEFAALNPLVTPTQPLDRFIAFRVTAK
ncbi:MAG: galactose-1-epimerase [Succinivibrionaceae bacterium]|nr:galactose-1-epimerase [Succinivibrionaceae bacterium]